ncbi:MAG: HD-GYP domain-containing protein [Candidatus Velthaea sp.]
MAALALIAREGPVRRPMSPLAADALTRIPSANFRSRAWARSLTETCAQLVTEAIARRDDARLNDWLGGVTAEPDAHDTIAVISSVCEAVIADAFNRHGDIRTITRWIAGLEQRVRAAFAAHQRGKDVDAMIDSDKAELAAGLVRVVGMHDQDTATHLDATAALARRIATEMDLAPDVVNTIELAALLHDVGKVAINPDIIRKPEALTAEEWKEMRMHPEAGASVILGITKLAHVAPIVRAHHERIDGYGYPDRLRGEDIPIEARVVAVADAFHAMTSERPYRRALMPSDALAILEDNCGTQFDVEVVAATLRLFRYTRRARKALAS